MLSSEILNFLRESIAAEKLECLPLAGDASTRKYFRIISGDESYVLMSWEPFDDPKSYPFLNVQAHYEACGVHVPKVRAVGAHLGVVLLEDLGDLTLERKFWENQTQEAVLPFYRQALDELVRIQFECSKPRSPASLCQTTQFDTAKFMWEMNYALDHFVEKVAEVSLSESQRTELQSELLEICETLHQQPKFVTHRDYHSRNVMLKLGKTVVIDFQDSRLGPLQYDLVSLFYDSYVQLSDSSVRSLMSYYHELALGYGVKDVLSEEFQKVMNLQTIQRCYKACGSFASFYNSRRDTRYLKYIKPTATRVSEALLFNGKFPRFTEIMTSSEVLDRDYEAL